MTGRRPLTAVATSGVTYRSETHPFFFSEPEINKLTLPGIPKQQLDKVTQFASSVAREYRQQVPIYTLKANDAKATTVRLLLKNIEVRSTEIHMTLGL